MIYTTLYNYNIDIGTISILRCQINVPPLINFSIFSNPQTLLGPPFINFKEIAFFTNASFHFLSLLVNITMFFPFYTSNYYIRFSSLKPGICFVIVVHAI